MLLKRSSLLHQKIADLGVAYARGWTRLVVIDHFTAHSKKAELTMADIVATVLYNHHPYTLDAFLNMEAWRNISFTRKEYDPCKLDLHT